MNASRVRLRLGDCVEVFAEFPEASFTHVICDPPYGLEYMSKDWDRLDWRDGGGMASVGLGGRATPWPSYSAGAAGTANATCATCGGRMRGAKRCECEEPDWKVKGEDLDLKAHARRMEAQEEWHIRWVSEAHRTLSEKGVLKAFGGSRTFHRLASAVVRSGFPSVALEAWIYGTGFPKSLDVSKDLDRQLGYARKPKRVPYSPNAVLRSGGQNNRPWMDKASRLGYHELPGDEPESEEAKAWEGWGTALKPAWEPVVVAKKDGGPSDAKLRIAHILRKPLSEGSVSRNVLKHGTGALNVSATTVESGLISRWPSNVILVHDRDCSRKSCSSNCAVSALERQGEGYSQLFLRVWSLE